MPDTAHVIEGAQEAVDLIRARILHSLEIFPFMGASMIHQSIGTSTSTVLWRPVLNGLVEDGAVCKKEVTCKTPLGRMQSYEIYHLPQNEYVYGPEQSEAELVSVA